MPTVQHSPFAAFASLVYVGGDDVTMTDDDDGFFVQFGCFGRH